MPCRGAEFTARALQRVGITVALGARHGKRMAAPIKTPTRERIVELWPYPLPAATEPRSEVCRKQPLHFRTVSQPHGESPANRRFLPPLVTLPLRTEEGIRQRRRSNCGPQ